MALAVGRGPAAAQPPPEPRLRLEAEAGFAGRYRIGSHLAVAATLDVLGVDGRGQLAFLLGGARLTQPVSFTAPSRKRYPAALPTSGYHERLRVELELADRTLVEEVELRPLPRSARVVLSVTAPGALGHRRSPGVPDDAELLAVDPADLPWEWSPYATAAEVILDESALASLRPAQVGALADWLLLGGKVTLVATRPERLLPLLLGEPAPAATPRPGGGAGLPVLGYGRGALRLFDPERAEPAAAWTSGGEPSAPRGLLGDSDLDLLRSLPAPPSVRPRAGGPLLVFSLLYLAAVTLVFATPRARRRRPPWTYAALLGVAALFGLGGGALGRVGPERFHETAVVHVFPHHQDSFVVARGDSLLTGPGRAGVELRLRGAGIDRDAGQGPVELELGEAGRAAVAVEGGMWARRRVIARGFRNLALRSDPQARRLANDSPARLAGCRLLADGGSVALPDIPPQGSVSLDAGEAGAPTASSGRPEGEPPLLARVQAAHRKRFGSASASVLCFARDLPASFLTGGGRRSETTEAVVVFHPPPPRGARIGGPFTR